LGVAKHGPIPTLWQIDDYLASRPLGSIILCQAGPQFSRLRSHDGILPDVIIRPASEHLDPNDRFLELIPGARELLLNNESQKTADPIVANESSAGKDLLQFTADSLPAQGFHDR